MTKKLCDYCGENSYMLFPCRNCGKSFCAVHRLPEKHDCTGDSSSYPEDLETSSYEPRYDSSGYVTPANAVERPREYVWEPNITELPKNPFDPKSGVVLKGVFLPRLNEIIHIIIAFILMFIIGYFSASLTFAQISQIPDYEPWEQMAFPYFLALMSTSGFLIHEFSHRQVGRHFDLPAKFRLLTFGMVLTIIGIVSFLAFGGPPFAIPGAVVVIGLENRDQAGKCKIAGPLSNLIISAILFPLAFIMKELGFEYFILFITGAYVNTFLAAFNLIPVGLLDGHNILKWNKKYYFIITSTVIALLVVEILIIMNPNILNQLYQSWYP